MDYCPICGATRPHQTCKPSVYRAIDAAETRSKFGVSLTEDIWSTPVVCIYAAGRIVAEMMHRDDETSDGEILPYDFEDGLTTWLP